jgi:hypothetical protein
MRPHACTIVSNNYLPFARVFARSFLEHHPDGRVFVLLVDTPHPSLRYDDEPFEALFAADLPIPAFPTFSFRYSILELNTAVKPYLLAHLQETHDLPALCYFDPDILVTGDLSPIYESLASNDAVLTPHVTEPLEDDRIPGERDFLLSGIYNLGFAGFGFHGSTRPFLEWWQRRLYRYCLHKVEEGLFTDQKWMDFAPAFLPRVEILRDPGYNTAYWNLPHRRIGRAGDGAWTVNGVPLRFFHFSGFSPHDLEQVSKYQDRYKLADRPDLTELFGHYRNRLLAEGYEELFPLPYGFGVFADGARVPGAARELLAQVDPDGERWADPFATGPESFRAWLTEPLSATGGDRAPTSRLALALWRRRADLRQAFPDPEHAQRRDLTGWLVDGGACEAGIDDALVAELRDALAAAPAGGEAGTTPETGSGDPGLSPAERAGRRLTTPTGTANPNRWRDLREDEVRWLTADDTLDSGEPRLPRWAMGIHGNRPDLQRSFPRPRAGSRLPFLRWLSTYGRREYRLPPLLVAPLLRRLSWKDRLYAHVWWNRQRLRKLTGR